MWLNKQQHNYLNNLDKDLHLKLIDHWRILLYRIRIFEIRLVTSIFTAKLPHHANTRVFH